MNKLLLSAALSFALVSFANAADTPAPTPAPIAQPAAQTEPSIVLTPADIGNIRKFIAGASMHAAAADGTQHPLIDGTEILGFFAQKQQMAAREAAREDAKQIESDVKEQSAKHPAPSTLSHSVEPTDLHGK